jgi:magnesium transporter
MMERRVHTTEELVNMKSDTLRNRILYVNMLLSLSSLAVAIVSAVGGIFGMNLQLPDALGDSPNAFGSVVFISSAGAFLIIIVIVFLLGRSGVLSAAV